MGHPKLIDRPDRLRSVFARIDSGDEGADIAFNIATKALRDAGVAWSDLLEAHLRQNPASASPGASSHSSEPSQAGYTPSQNKSASAFGSFFDGFDYGSVFKNPNRASAAARTAPKTVRKFVSGIDIPDIVSGRIVESDRRPTRKGRMVVVNVEADDGTSYGPLVIFGEKDIERLDTSDLKFFVGNVRQTGDARHMPQLWGLRI